MSAEKQQATSTIGWRELVDFPEWGIRGVEAKVDTGARTSSLHVENIEHLPGDRVRFLVVLSRKDPHLRIEAEAPLVRWSSIKSSTGHRQERLIVSTRIQIGSYEREIEMSLVSRHGLLCRMLLGRRALEDGLLVDPTRRYLLSRETYRATRPKRSARQKTKRASKAGDS